MPDVILSVSDARDKEKLIKLAPFKFPFSKMSKSRSSDEKDREKDKESAEQAVDNDTGKEKADCEKDVEEDTIGENEEGDEKGATNGCNGERNTNVDYDTEDNAKGENVQLPLNQLQLATELESNLKSPVFASNSLMVRNELAIPSSPPPSYEHVIEQVKIWVIVANYEEITNFMYLSNNSRRNSSVSSFLHGRDYSSLGVWTNSVGRSRSLPLPYENY